MSDNEGEIQHVESSRLLQGCLVGSVAVFALLMVGLLILAYLRFREFTGEDAGTTPPVQTSLAAPPHTPPHASHFPALTLPSLR